MAIEFKLNQFNGPLDLLLALLGENKLDITELALSEITEQYLAHLDTIDESKTAELADFLVIAAKLLLLKSKSLLPQFMPEEEEGQSLEDQLRLYKLFVEASKQLNARWVSGQRSAFRIEPPRKIEAFVPPESLTRDKLHGSMLRVVERLAPPKPLPKTHIDKTVSVKEKINHIRGILKKRTKTTFHEILADAGNKTELIVGFLALLELVKLKHVSLSQDQTFSNIVIDRAVV